MVAELILLEPSPSPDPWGPMVESIEATFSELIRGNVIREALVDEAPGLGRTTPVNAELLQHVTEENYSLKITIRDLAESLSFYSWFSFFLCAAVVGLTCTKRREPVEAKGLSV